MEIATNVDQQPLNKPRGQRRPLANPFGNIAPSATTEDEFDLLNSTDQSFNSNPSSRNTNALKTPFPQSANNNNDDELEGSISLGNGENPRPAKQNAPAQNRDSYAISYQNDFVGFEPQTTQPKNNSGNAGGSLMGSLMGFASMLTSGQGNAQPAAEYDEENEPPLLEDLGIDLKLIKMRALSVMKFQKCPEEFVAEADMTGPLVLFLVFGTLLLFSGKVHFGYIYGFGTIGTIGVYLMMNLISQVNRVKLYNTMSILGYCLFPIVILAFFNIFISLVNAFGFILGVAAIGWSTVAATNFFQVLLNLNEQKWMVAYPIFLFYLVFVIITVF